MTDEAKLRAQRAGRKLRELREQKGLTQTELAQLLPNESKVSISRYETGVRTIPEKKIDLLAEIFGVSALYFMGRDELQKIAKPSNIVPIGKEFKKGLLVGDIACGTPINQEECEEMLIPYDADIALYCKGDSMINIGINDGDIVFIRYLDGFDEMINGRIAAVGIGDDYEYTLKRWFYNETKHTLKLVPENDAYKPLIFTGEELADIHLLGVAVGYTSVL